MLSSGVVVVTRQVPSAMELSGSSIRIIDHINFLICLWNRCLYTPQAVSDAF